MYQRLAEACDRAQKVESDGGEGEYNIDIGMFPNITQLRSPLTAIFLALK